MGVMKGRKDPLGGALKLYKKPKPGRSEEGVGPDDPQVIVDQWQQGSSDAKTAAQPAHIPGDPSRPFIALGVLLVVLTGVLIYIFYKPAPPAVVGPRDRISLMPACQGGNATACAEAALLDYRGTRALDGEPTGDEPNTGNAFFLARLGCARGSAFGCYLMWHLWFRKETALLKPETADQTLRKGCSYGSELCCLFADRFKGRAEISAEEWEQARAAAVGKSRSRYAKTDEEDRLFKMLLAP